MKLTKAQLEARKKRRERNKPVRHRWRMYLRQVAREYNAGEVLRVHAS